MILLLLCIRVAFLVKSPAINQTLSLKAPQVTMASAVPGLPHLYQLSQNDEVLSLFNRVREGDCHSLELVSGEMILVSGNLPGHYFKFAPMNEPGVSVAEVFGWQVESGLHESFHVEYAAAHEARLSEILMVVILSCLDLYL